MLQCASQDRATSWPSATAISSCADSQRQVGRKEAEAAGDEILVGGHRGGVRGVVPVRESDQRRRVDERDVPQDFTVRGV